MKVYVRLTTVIMVAVLLFFIACFNDSGDDSGIQESPKTLAIGDAYKGGIIAYIFQPGDLGYIAGEQHGMIAAIADQSTDIVWVSGGSTQTTIVPGGTPREIGKGLTNTANIISQAVAAGNTSLSTYAAGVCEVYSNTDTGTGVYTDWYLPSRDELNKLFINRVAIGGFASLFYWSSSESSDSYAWYQHFGTSLALNTFPKSSTYRVRAVRSF